MLLYPVMDYDATIKYLYGLQTHGIKLGLDNIREMLARLDNPHKGYRTIHIAGTNGKGTTAATLQSILSHHGQKTGLFTSPHLCRFTERIRIDGTEITEGEVISLTRTIRDKIRGISPTFFEVVTAMAFLYYKIQGVNSAVIETGLGGRFDSTNVLIPSVSIITRIDLDHKEFLGNDIASIAGEKAGIIKEGVPVVSTAQSDDALDVLKSAAARNNSEFYLYGRDFFADDIIMDSSGSTFTYRGGITIPRLRTPIIGKRQIENLSSAIKAAESIIGADISRPSLYAALADIRWPGRCELIRYHGCELLMDGAHNPAALRHLAQTISETFSKRNIILIFAAMADKETGEMLRSISPIARETILTAPSYGRAARPEDLRDKLLDSDVLSSLHIAATTREALDKAISLYNPNDDLIVMTGSFYLVGEARELAGFKSLYRDLSESSADFIGNKS